MPGPCWPDLGCLKAVGSRAGAGRACAAPAWACAPPLPATRHRGPDGLQGSTSNVATSSQVAQSPKSDSVASHLVDLDGRKFGMTQGDDFFDPWQRVVSDWPTALDAINKILELATTGRNMAWRGVKDASYSLHSSLYRWFVTQLTVTPDEDGLAGFEREMVRRARANWRFDNLSALEILAHIQHYGGPTRLLDVTFNPLIALWFSVERKYDEHGLPMPDADGRIFAFDVTKRQIELDDDWGGRNLPWDEHPRPRWRRELPLVWRPPSYNDRIPAQNSAFLLGGVPQVYSGGNTKYRKGPGDGTVAGIWNIDEVRQSTSVTVRMNSLERKPQFKSTPTYTLRVAAAAKSELRQFLEKSFGFNASTIYPDLFGLAQNVANGIDVS
jgi:hypothetical protein